MKKLETPYTFKTVKEAVKAFDDLLNSKKELDENADILPFFKQYPALILGMSRLVGMSHIPIDALELNFQLSENQMCDIAFGSSLKNTYCLVKFKDAKKNSLFSGLETYRAFSTDFEKGNSQVIDWLWKIDSRRNREDVEGRFACKNPTISTALIIGRSEFLNVEERDRLVWREEKTWVNSNKIHYITYDDLLECFKSLIKERENNRLLV